MRNKYGCIYLKYLIFVSKVNFSYRLGLAEVAECSLLSPLTVPFFGQNLEIEQIVADSFSSSEKLQMDKANKLDDSHSSKGENSSLVTLYSNPLHSPCHEKFAPKEVESLRRQLKSFDNGMSTSFYPGPEQAICLTCFAPPVLDFLKETADGMFFLVLGHVRSNFVLDTFGAKFCSVVALEQAYLKCSWIFAARACDPCTTCSQVAMLRCTVYINRQVFRVINLSVIFKFEESCLSVTIFYFDLKVKPRFNEPAGNRPNLFV